MTIRDILERFNIRLPKLKGNQNVRDAKTGRYTKEFDRFTRPDEVVVETDKKKK